MDADAYCRDIEGHLCRKNDGHLIRIVGPAFELVVGWAEGGIPLKVAFKGIDRYVERSYAKGPRRRPVRVEFCEADVLDVFDQWRRAVGVPAAAPGSASDAEGARRGRSMTSHLDRVMTRLTACRAGGQVPEALNRQIERIVGELDAARVGSRGIRGEARAALVARLDQIDRELIEVAVAAADAATIDDLGREAASELSPFRGRMSADAFSGAVSRATRRLLRERIGLPSITFE